MEIGTWTMKYGSFIYLGLSLTVGYVVWMVFRPKTTKKKDDLGEELLRREVERMEAPKNGAASGSGLEGPALTPEQQAALDAAETDRRVRAAMEKGSNG